jgi:hypothetical protein
MMLSGITASSQLDHAGVASSRALKRVSIRTGSREDVEERAGLPLLSDDSSSVFGGRACSHDLAPVKDSKNDDP